MEKIETTPPYANASQVTSTTEKAVQYVLSQPQHAPTERPSIAAKTATTSCTIPVSNANTLVLIVFENQSALPAAGT